MTAVLGLLLNDSGVVIPAMMMLIVVPVAVVAAIDRPRAAAEPLLGDPERQTLNTTHRFAGS